MARVRRKITNDKSRAIQVAGRWIQPGGSETFDLEQLPPEWRGAGVAVPDTEVKKVPAMIPEGTEPLTVTTSSGVLEFSEPALNRAVRSAIPHILSDADIEARPPRLWPVDAVPYRLFCALGGYAYGHTSDISQIVKVDVTTRASTLGYKFPAGWSISDIYAGHDCVLVMAVETASLTYSLWRTTDGTTLTRVHDIGREPDGVTHRQHVRILQRGLSPGKIGGQPALLFATYNIATDNGIANPGEIGDAIYISKSLDDGVTWQRVNTWNWDYGTNTGLRTMKHFHAVRYDQWRDAWWICVGDSNDESCIIRWDGIAPGPGNVTPAAIQAGTYPGWSCRTGSQRWRAVDLLITEDWIESFTDSIGNVTGGIWRCKPDFSQSHRVDHTNRGQNHDGWAALRTSGGTHIWCDDCRADAVTSTQRFIGLYASANGNRYFEIGRIALAGTGVKIPRGFFEAGGNVWFSCDGEAGKGAYNTTVFKLSGKFREERPDNLAPAYFVDFANGSDAANGYGQATAWKTARNLFGSNRVTHGARIVLSDGTSTENGVSTIDYAANATPAVDTTRPIQISGQGRDSTVVVLSGAVEGWKDASAAKTWAVELCAMTLRQSDPTKAVLWDNASPTGGTPEWVIRDAQIGNQTVGASRALYLRGSAARVIRSTIANISDSTKYNLYIDGAATVDLQASLIVGGRSIQRTGGKVSARHCEFAGFANNGLAIDLTATVAPLIANTVFGMSDQIPIVNNSGTVTLTSADCYGNVFSATPAGAGVPDPVLPAAGLLDRDPDTLIPFSFSALGGVAAAAGVQWDYYGQPFRAKPAIGAVELSDF